MFVSLIDKVQPPRRGVPQAVIACAVTPTLLLQDAVWPCIAAGEGDEELQDLKLASRGYVPLEDSGRQAGQTVQPGEEGSRAGPKQLGVRLQAEPSGQDLILGILAPVARDRKLLSTAVDRYLHWPASHRFERHKRDAKLLSQGVRDHLSEAPLQAWDPVPIGDSLGRRRGCYVIWMPRDPARFEHHYQVSFAHLGLNGGLQD